MKLVLSDIGSGKIVYAVTTTTYLNRDEIDALTDEQRSRLEPSYGAQSATWYTPPALRAWSRVCGSMDRNPLGTARKFQSTI